LSKIGKSLANEVFHASFLHRFDNILRSFRANWDCSIKI